MSDDDQLLKSVASQNAKSLLAAYERAELDLLDARHTMERQMEQLDQSRALLLATLEATGDGIMATDGEGHVSAANRRYAEIWKLSPEVEDQRDHRRYAEVCAKQFAEPQKYL